MHAAAHSKKTTSKPTGGGVSSTKPVATGPVLPVSDRLDLWYLCEKAAYAKLTPFRRRKDNAPMYQRAVSKLVRLDNEAFDYRFPYCGEVGFDMGVNPPQPLMSRREGRRHRPSSFPISQYQQLRSNFMSAFPSLRIENELLSKHELEAILSTFSPSNTGLIWIDAKNQLAGLVRIPDVVRLKSFQDPGKAQYSQHNLASVIEMKFPGDVLSPPQQLAYQRIAGDPSRLRLLETVRCEGADRETWRSWIRANGTEPVYRPVGQVMSLASRASAGKHRLLLGDMDAEHEAARRLLEFQVPAPGPQMKAAENNDRYLENQKAGAAIGLSLTAPFLAIGAVAAAVEAPAVLTAETITAAANVGGESAAFPLFIGRAWKQLTAAISGAGTGAVAYAAASDPPTVSSETREVLARIEAWNAYQKHQPTIVQNYVLWEDLPEKDND